MPAVIENYSFSLAGQVFLGDFNETDLENR
jgi:hypothetical protein